MTKSMVSCGTFREAEESFSSSTTEIQPSASPNPLVSGDILNIVSTSSNIKEISLISAGAKEIINASFTIDGNKAFIETVDIPSGIYIVRVVSNDNIESHKVSIE